MDEAELKEAYRLFWLVKGHMNCSDETALRSADGYFKRLWNNESQCLDEYEIGFEQAYKAREAEILNEEMTKVARLGYD